MIVGTLKVEEGALDVVMAFLGSFNPIGMSESEDPGVTAVPAANAEHTRTTEPELQ